MIDLELVVIINSAEEFVRLRLSENVDDYLRAAREEANIYIWLEVIGKYPDLKYWVAHNTTVQMEVLEVLSDDLCWQVRHMVASKNKLSEELQIKLANDRDPSVRQRIVNNKRATISALLVLSKDEELEIKEMALKKLAKLGFYKNV
ncbi:hypothetical protein ACT8ZS_00105 [Paenibacillus sp. M.A.Huq-84]